MWKILSVNFIVKMKEFLNFNLKNKKDVKDYTQQLLSGTNKIEHLQTNYESEN